MLCDHRCQHVQHLSDWCSANDVHLDKETPLQDEQTFKSVSSYPIPYPLPTHLRYLHDKHERGDLEFPLQLVPPYSDAVKCKHGHLFNPGDPIQNGWISKKGAIIHKEAVTIEDENRTVFYRPSLGSCSCKQAYDGQDDLLLNLDDRHLFYYGYLFQYLHLMLEGKNPLIAFLRASSRSFSVQSHTKPVSIKLLRQAWNAFARLLSIDFVESFSCPICGPSPSTVICDGTLTGFRKDLMETFEAENPSHQSQQPVQGSSHSSRIMLKSRKSRELLLKYSGYNRDRKCIQNPKNLSPSEFKQLLALLKKEGALPLAQVISHISSESHQRRASQPYREIMYELSLNTPVCGMIQIAGNSEALEAIRLISSGVDIRHIQYQCELKLLQNVAPVIASCILKLPFTEPIPADVCSLLSQLCELLLAPFQDVTPQAIPDPPVDKKLSFFPSLPIVRGIPVYAADQLNSSQKPENVDSCRKYASSHPTLTPGIFTVYCPHAICYGFKVMRSHESPRHPFEIFLTRFHQPPANIIYDNSCKLHQYILNRQPTHFQNTNFFVNRFHWRGHIGCSSGYSLDKYTTPDITLINSQVNEQANAGLQWIKGQIAYMKPENFMFHVKLFLSVTNMDKRARLDLGKLSI